MVGAAGRMGQAILRALDAAPGVAAVAALEREGHPDLDGDAAEAAGATARGVILSADIGAALQPGRVVIDFTAPGSTAALVSRAAAAGCKAVIGTTGLDTEHLAAIAAAAEQTAVLHAPNMSVGVNVLFGLLERAAKALGAGWDMEIVELHHRRKKDAPSGTAERMATVLAGARGLPDGAIVRERSGQVGERRDDELGVVAVRGGDVAGEHTAFFFGDGERLEITHRATHRGIFAAGAVRAARWISQRDAGLYSMADVLAL